jgi:hypothetical protein
MAGLSGPNTVYVAWAAPSCPINTPATSPLTLDMDVLDQCFLWTFNVRIPPGHAGYTGIALTDSGSFVVPYAQPGPAWLIGDDDDLSFEIEQETGSTVQLAYYNTSTDFSHGWQVRITYTPMSVMQTQSDVIVTPDVADWAQAIEGTTGG